MAKKKTTAFKVITVSIIYLAAAALAIYLITYFLNKPKFVRYAAFGIPIPVSYQIHGIDVSRYQAAIDWEAVRDMQDKNIKIGFAFIGYTGSDVLNRVFSVANKKLNSAIDYKTNIADGATGNLEKPTPTK